MLPNITRVIPEGNYSGEGQPGSIQYYSTLLNNTLKVLFSFRMRAPLARAFIALLKKLDASDSNKTFSRTAAPFSCDRQTAVLFQLP